MRIDARFGDLTSPWQDSTNEKNERSDPPTFASLPQS